MLTAFFKYLKKTLGFLLFILTLILIKSFLLDISLVPTSSMSPNILPADLVLVTKYDYGYSSYSIAPISFGNAVKKIFSKTPSIGDVIIFKINRKSPAMVKRVIGTPGQKIQLIQGILFINDVAVEKTLENIITDTDGIKCAIYKEKLANGLEYKIMERVHIPEDKLEELENTEPFIVPKNQYFCLGDYRHNSKDSRYIGCIDQTKITAKARAIIFSFKSFIDIKQLKRVLKPIK